MPTCVREGAAHLTSTARADKRCPYPELFLGTDEMFREQVGVRLTVSYPLDALTPTVLPVAEGGPVHFFAALPGDLIRLVPACELACGADASSPAGQRFPFQTIDVHGNVSSAALTLTWQATWS